MEENKQNDSTEKVENKEEVKVENKNEKEKELKKEASNTVNQVKDTIKNTNIKQDSAETKKFITEMLSKPATKLKDVVTDTTGKTLKYAIILLVVWSVVGVVNRMFGGAFNEKSGIAMLWDLCKGVLVPVLTIGVFSVIVLLFNKENKKSLTTIFSAITIAHVPVIVAKIIALLNYIPGQIYRLTSPISTFCSVATVILTYIAVKNLLEKDDDEAIKAHIGIEIVYEIVALILTFINIYI